MTLTTWTVISKAAKLWPVTPGLCFIAHSLEQHDQASTKGAFVIRPRKRWAWCHESWGMSWAFFILHCPFWPFWNFQIVKYVSMIQFHRCFWEVPSKLRVWKNSKQLLPSGMRPGTGWIFAGVPILLVWLGLELRSSMDLIWITFEIWLNIWNNLSKWNSWNKWNSIS